VEAVEDALAGQHLDSPELQPSRTLNSPQDFASLYIRHRSSFEAHARKFHNDQRDVDEVVQETFLRLFLAMPEIENELQALAFSRRVLTNLCIDRYRAAQRRPMLVALDNMDNDVSVDEIDDPVARAEDAAIVRQALALLSPLHRAALIKREIEEKPLSQIAVELDIPEDNVKHLLHRARRALRRLLVGTTVQPNVDLTNGEMLRIANERLAKATLRGANVLIVMFVAVFAVVGGLRVTSSSQGVQEGGVNGVLPAPVRPAPVPAAGQRKPARATIVAHPNAHATSARPSHRARSVHVVSKPVAQPVTTTHKSSGSSWRPVVNAPVHNTKPPVVVPPVTTPPVTQPPAQGGATATSAPFTLTGSLTTVGAPALVDQQTLQPTDTTPVLFSRFVADTTNGEFSLKQTVAQSPGDSPTVNVHVRLPIAGQSVVAAPVAYSSSTTTSQTGEINVEQQLSVVPVSQDGTASTTGEPTAVSVHITLAPDAQSVVSESVNVENQPTAPTPGGVVGTTTPAAPTSPVVSPAGGVGAVVNNDSAKGVIADFAVVGRPENSSGVN